MTINDPVIGPDLSREALAGVRVLDAATLGAAPFAAAMLAEFGAEVIKIEDPKHGDPLRDWGPQKDGFGLMWKTLARNKKSITLNLRLEAGQEVFRELVAKSDVLVVNFRPGRLEAWNLGYQQLRTVNPGLVMLHLTGFGQTGAYSDRPGFGTLAEAMSGFSHITGQPGGPPTLPPFMLADGVASLTATWAIMIALYHRDVHGAPGQFIDVSLLEPLMRLLELMYIEYDQTGYLWPRIGNQWKTTVPRNTYLTRDDKWIAMSGSSPSVALRVFDAIGRPELANNPDFATAQGRLANADEIDSIVAAWIREHDLEDALATFVRAEVAAGPVYDAAQVMNDIHVKTRGIFTAVPDPDLRSVTVQTPVPRMSDTPGRIKHLGVALGSHNPEIYEGLLQYSAEKSAALKAAGVI